MNNFNYNMALLEEQVFNVLQSIELPIGVSYLIISKIAQNLETLYNQQVQSERQAMIKLNSASEESEAIEGNTDIDEKPTE